MGRSEEECFILIRSADGDVWKKFDTKSQANIFMDELEYRTPKVAAMMLERVSHARVLEGNTLQEESYLLRPTRHCGWSV